MHREVFNETLSFRGGGGTRLKVVFADVPKALAPVSGLPFLEHWFGQGLRVFTFLLHHQAVRAYLRFSASAPSRNTKASELLPTHVERLSNAY